MPRPERILVTGAAGFIGARVVEALILRGRGAPRAGVRRLSSAARLGRLQADVVPCDVERPAQLARAMQGVDAVVHAAYGPGALHTEGTRNVLRAATRAGVRRVVHLSTVSVYGAAEGRLSETAPLQRGFSRHGDTKIDAEAICRAHRGHGLDVVILRPSGVYGPFGRTWTIRYASRMSEARWKLPRGYGAGTCNLVYVDDLVRAIFLALECEGVGGEAFNICGSEPTTWRDYLQALGEACRLPPVPETSLLTYRLRDVTISPLRVGARSALRRFGPLLGTIQGRSSWARTTVNAVESALRATSTTEELRFYARKVSYPIEKARSRLGYEPLVGLPEGIDLSVAWLRHHGYLDTVGGA